MKIIITKIILFFKNSIEKLIDYLVKKKQLTVAFYLSKFFRYFFLREYFVKKIINYKDIDDLKSLVKKEKILKLKRKINFNLKGKKIFFLGPKKYNFKNNWVNTAKNLHAKVYFFSTDDVSYIESNQRFLKNIKKFELNLIKKIKLIKPDLIFLDVNYLGNKNTINQNTINKIKSLNISKLKITGWIGDIYSNDAFEIVKYWAKSIDLVIYSEPMAKTIITQPNNIINFKYINYCVNEKLYYPKKKKKLLFFSGTANISRYPYLIKIIKNSVLFRNILVLYQNKYNKLSLTLSQYSKNICQSQSVVNLSSRNIPYLRVLAGRAFEAIASKALLIEEKNESITKLFKPYRDFIPFDSVKELLIAINFAKRYPNLTKQICENAYNNYNNKYHSKYFWKKLFILLN